MIAVPHSIRLIKGAENNTGFFWIGYWVMCGMNIVVGGVFIFISIVMALGAMIDLSVNVYTVRRCIRYSSFMDNQDWYDLCMNAYFFEAKSLKIAFDLFLHQTKPGQL